MFKWGTAEIEGVDLPGGERTMLEEERRDARSRTDTYRYRCQIILFKAGHSTYKEVAEAAEWCEVVVNSVELRFTCIGSSDTRSKASQGWLCAKGARGAPFYRWRVISPPFVRPYKRTGGRQA